MREIEEQRLKVKQREKHTNAEREREGERERDSGLELVSFLRLNKEGRPFL